MSAPTRPAAVAVFGPLRVSGFFAWLFWLFLHLLYLVVFANRRLVPIQWAWSYLMWNRSARLRPVDAEAPSRI